MFIAVFLLVVFVCNRLVDHNIYNSKVLQLDNAIHSRDINEIKKLFGNRYSNTEMKNLISWTKYNPEETKEQLELLKNNVKRFNGDFDKRNLQPPSSLALIEPEPLIILTKDGLFSYSFKLKPQTLYFTFDKNNYRVFLNGNPVELKVKNKEICFYTYEVTPNFYTITIKDSDSKTIYSEKVYPYSNIKPISIHIPEITPGWN